MTHFGLSMIGTISQPKMGNYLGTTYVYCTCTCKNTKKYTHCEASCTGLPCIVRRLPSTLIVPSLFANSVWPASPICASNCTHNCKTNVNSFSRYTIKYLMITLLLIPGAPHGKLMKSNSNSIRLNVFQF